MQVWGPQQRHRAARLGELQLLHGRVTWGFGLEDLVLFYYKVGMAQKCHHTVRPSQRPPHLPHGVTRAAPPPAEHSACTPWPCSTLYGSITCHLSGPWLLAFFEEDKAVGAGVVSHRPASVPPHPHDISRPQLPVMQGTTPGKLTLRCSARGEVPEP